MQTYFLHRFIHNIITPISHTGWTELQVVCFATNWNHIVSQKSLEYFIVPMTKILSIWYLKRIEFIPEVLFCYLLLYIRKFVSLTTGIIWYSLRMPVNVHVSVCVREMALCSEWTLCLGPPPSFSTLWLMQLSRNVGMKR